MEISEIAQIGTDRDRLEIAPESGERASCVPVPTALYRHFDADGNLLYVGISLNAVQRLSQHRASSHWYRSISKIEIEWLPSRLAAESAEIEAIRSEKPAHNLMHVGGNSLAAALSGHPKAFMVKDGVLDPAYSSFSTEEADELADRL